MKAFDAETENKKHQMHSTMKANAQTESSRDDDRSSTGSYKARAQKEVNKQPIAMHVANQITMHPNAK